MSTEGGQVPYSYAVLGLEGMLVLGPLKQVSLTYQSSRNIFLYLPQESSRGFLKVQWCPVAVL